MKLLSTLTLGAVLAGGALKAQNIDKDQTQYAREEIFQILLNKTHIDDIKKKQVPKSQLKHKNQYDRLVTAMSLVDMQYTMTNYLNQVREKNGLPLLALIDTPAAQLHSQYLFETGKDQHLDKGDHYGAKGSTPILRLAQSGINCTQIGENIASIGVDSTVKNIVDGWMESPGHRANILSAKYLFISIGHHPTSSNLVLKLFGID